MFFSVFSDFSGSKTPSPSPSKTISSFTSCPKYSFKGPNFER